MSDDTTRTAFGGLSEPERTVYLLRRLRELENLVVMLGGEIADLRARLTRIEPPQFPHDMSICRDLDCPICLAYRPPRTAGSYYTDLGDL